jgi:hypothetical protein
VLAAEGQQHEERRERDDDRKDGAREDGRRRRAGALFCNLVQVRCLTDGCTDRAAEDAVVLRHLRELMVLHMTTIAVVGVPVCAASRKIHYPPAGVSGWQPAARPDGR